MKTLEEVNGQKVWAVDLGGLDSCSGCVFGSKHYPPLNPACDTCNNFNGREVIFLPYEEELKEKIFTLSQINEVMGDIHKWCAFNLSAPEHVVAYKVLSQLIQKLEQL